MEDINSIMNNNLIDSIAERLMGAYEVGMVLDRGPHKSPDWESNKNKEKFENDYTIGANREMAREVIRINEGVQSKRCIKCKKPRPEYGFFNEHECVVCHNDSENIKRQVETLSKYTSKTVTEFPVNNITDSQKLQRVYFELYNQDNEKISTEDPMWSPALQLAYANKIYIRDLKTKYQELLCCAKKRNVPIQKLERDLTWKDYDGELDFINFTYRLKPEDE